MEVDGGPAYRMWPPVAVGGPLVLGLLLSSWVGDPLAGSAVTSLSGWLFLAAFVVWNGWALVMIAKHRTALLLALPLEWALLRWGAVVPEEQYLAARFGATYTDYTGRVRRWI